MKTRSNMPLFVVACSNVKQLTDEQINMLRCGDWLVKRDASGEHAYKVTYKSDTGMCITYYDASVIETQSYDFVDGHWVYNSEDKTPNLLDAQTEDDVIDLLGSGEVPSVKAGEIVENMSGYSFTPLTTENLTIENIYVGVCKNGNKITFVQYCNITRTGSIPTGLANIGQFNVPNAIHNKLYPDNHDWLDMKSIYCGATAESGVNLPAIIEKQSNNRVVFRLLSLSDLTQDTSYRVRFECTFLLSENLAE